MKRFVPAVLVLLLLLSGCSHDAVPILTAPKNSDPATTTSTPAVRPEVIMDLNVFSQWLDSEKLIPGLEQADFLQQIGTYNLNGVPGLETAKITEYSSTSGGAYIAEGEDFSFEEKTDVASDRYMRTRRITFETLLEGMTNPLVITFDDTFSSVLMKLVDDFDAIKDFQPDKENRYQMTLWEGASDKLVISHKLFSDHENPNLISYSTATNYVDGTRLTNVDRSVIFEFDPDDGSLISITLEICETTSF